MTEHHLSPEHIEAAARAVDRRLRERAAEQSLRLAYRSARRVLSSAQAEAACADAERRVARVNASRPHPVPSGQALAEIRQMLLSAEGEE